MTLEEIVRKAIGTYPIFEASVAWMAMVRAVKMGQAEERERCAKIAEEMGTHRYRSQLCAEIAAAIRSTDTETESG
jgi:hypothetical protein